MPLTVRPDEMLRALDIIEAAIRGAEAALAG
jgi:hypothetical protein